MSKNSNSWLKVIKLGKKEIISLLDWHGIKYDTKAKYLTLCSIWYKSEERRVSLVNDLDRSLLGGRVEDSNAIAKDYLQSLAIKVEDKIKVSESKNKNLEIRLKKIKEKYGK